MHISEKGVKFISSFEGFSSAPYRDSVGVWTIGYGHTEGVGPSSRHLSQQQALALLKSDLANKYEKPVDDLHLPFNQNQYDALVSFVYNLGGGVLSTSSTMGIALRRRNWRQAADAFMLYDHAGGQVLAGLYRRRKAERSLFLAHPFNRLAHKIAKWDGELANIRKNVHRQNGHWNAKQIARAKALEEAIRNAR